MPAESDARRRLVAVADGSLSPSEFGQWLMPRVRALREGGSDALVELVESILLLFGESANGEWKDEDLRRELASLAGPPGPSAIVAEVEMAPPGAVERPPRTTSASERRIVLLVDLRELGMYSHPVPATALSVGFVSREMSPPPKVHRTSTGLALPRPG